MSSNANAKIHATGTRFSIRRAVLSAYVFLFACGFGSSITWGETVNDTVNVWIGTGGGAGQGVYHTTLDIETGQLETPKLAAEMQSSGFLCLHPDQNHLYVGGNRDGQGVTAVFEIKQHASGATLEFLNAESIGVGKPTCVALTGDARFLLSVQYGAGTVVALPLSATKTLLPVSDLVQHEGATKVHPRRQEAAHPHWIGVDPNNHHVFVPDLGQDQVVIYRLDDEGKLNRHGAAAVPPGGGPRHMKFSSDARFAYVLNELTMTVTVFRYDETAGTMESIQNIETLPADAKEFSLNTAAEIRIHPSGKFLYTSNRGDDSITAFSVDADSGQLTLLEREPIRGHWPRNFNIDPSGKWLLAAGARSNTLAVFEIKPDGTLVFSGNIVNVPNGICVEFSSAASG